MADMLVAVEDWATHHNAKFHVGKDKTVSMRFSAGGTGEVTLDVRFFFDNREGDGPQELVEVHRWLGPLWPRDLVFVPDMKQRLAIAGTIFTTLANLVDANVVPLPMAVVLFESKVDSILTLSQWIWVGQEEVEETLNRQYDTWSRLLLGALPWRNAAVATSEIGWALGGHDRAIKDAALRRARLWLRPIGDLYRDMFYLCHEEQCGWAKRSLDAITSAGIVDFPKWESTDKSLPTYKLHVESRLLARSSSPWEAEVEKHTAQVPYTQVCPRRGGYLHKCLSASLGWTTLLGSRSHCRLRAGLILLRSRGGKKSTAKYQD